MSVLVAMVYKFIDRLLVVLLLIDLHWLTIIVLPVVIETNLNVNNSKDVVVSMKNGFTDNRNLGLFVESAWIVAMKKYPARHFDIIQTRGRRRMTLYHDTTTMNQKRNNQIDTDYNRPQPLTLTNDDDDDFGNQMNDRCLRRRRLFLSSHLVLLGGLYHDNIQVANAVSTTITTTNHRQLELCLVSVLRVMYWAQYEIQRIDDNIHTRIDSDNNNDNNNNSIIDQQRSIYLETRLGAKAALTGRISGSGATGRVYTLTTLQLTGCLQDLEWYGLTTKTTSTKQLNRNLKSIIGDTCTSFREGLASIVEFDGLDTLTDPSPRSSLTMSQYNIDKLKFIRRTLYERILPDGQTLVLAFGPEAYQRSNGYIQQYYSSEIPIRPPTTSLQSD